MVDAIGVVLDVGQAPKKIFFAAEGENYLDRMKTPLSVIRGWKISHDR